MKAIDVAIVAAVIAGVFWIATAPELLVDPGPLSQGHAKLQGQCFSCHSVFLGPSERKCKDCHKPEKIRRVRLKNVQLHRHLDDGSCASCHTDHRGPKVRKPYREFIHDRLADAFLRDCQRCHAKPRDSRHRDIKTGCSECHGDRHWRPAELDHKPLFRFDRDHPPACTSCHREGDYRTYTCYGCHEHSVAKSRREHREEGIRQFEDCETCHRSGDEDEAERLWKKMRRAGKRR